MIATKKIARFLMMAGVLTLCTYVFLLVFGLCVYFIVLKSFNFDLISFSKANTVWQVDDSQMVLFPNLKGPLKRTRPMQTKATTWRKFANNQSHDFAIYLTDTNSNFLGLAHAFQSFGVPISMYTNLQEALQHKVVMIYPMVTEETIHGDEMELLKKHVQDGGTLIGTNVSGKTKSLFGIKYNKLKYDRFSAFLVHPEDTLFRQFRFPEEHLLSFGSKKDNKIIFESYGYKPSTAAALIQFEDSTALLTREKKGKGNAFGMGLDLGDFFIRCQNSRGFNPGRTYVNGFEPTMDVLMRTLKKIYQMHEPNAICLGTVPFNKSCTIVLTHDIDYSLSIENTVGYSEMERRKGVKASYFIQTKYIKDWNDNFFYNKKGIACLQKVVANKMEIASHSVSHSRVFCDFNYGTGNEKYPEYRPFVKEKRVTMNGTVLGELRVSKYLLETFLPGTIVTSFRAGHLSNPNTLPQALTASSYLSSSNETANNCLTHLPFQSNYNHEFTQEVPIYEYPVTIEDEEAPGLGKRLQKSIELIDKISSYGGFICILIHTDSFGEKIKFEEDIIDRYINKAYFSTLKDFHTWWSCRAAVKTKVVRTNNKIHLEIQSATSIEGLGIEIPLNWHLDEGQIHFQQKGSTIILPTISGIMALNFTLNIHGVVFH